MDLAEKEDSGLENRIGRFDLDRKHINSAQAPEVFSKLKFVPLKITPEPHRDIFCYEGYSEMFDPIQYGDAIPKYEILVVTDGNGEVEIVMACQLEAEYQ